MIPPQLALFAAKHAKKLIYVAIFLAVLFSIWLAFTYHKSVVARNAELTAELSTTELARRVDAAKMDAQAGAIQQWKDSHDELQATLRDQERVSKDSRVEKRKLNETFRDHDLTRLAAAKPSLVERIINRGTARMQRLLVCASASARCDDNGNPIPTGETESSEAESSGDGTLPLERSGAGILARSGRSVLLPDPSRLRISRTQPGGDLAFHSRDDVAAGLLPKGRE